MQLSKEGGTMKKRYLIVNHGHPFGPFVITENDSGIYDSLGGAIDDMACASKEHDNDSLQIHELGPAVAAAQDYEFCEECWRAYAKGTPHECDPRNVL